MGIYPYKGIYPQIDDTCFIAPSADIIGDVTIGANSSIWFGVVIRGDVSSITIGQNVSIQENSVVHVDHDMPTVIGDNVTVGHACIVHAATIKDNCLIGMGSTVLDQAVIGQGSLIGAGALVPPRKNIPPRSQAIGMPCSVVKQLDEAAEEGFIAHAARYVRLKNDYMSTNHK